MKEVIEGYVGKDKEACDILQSNVEGVSIEVYKFKGSKDEWWPITWPPKRVRITIEIEEIEEK